MTIKEQLQKIKENWLLVLVLLAAVVLFTGLPTVLQQSVFQPGFGGYEGAAAESKIAIGMPSPIYDNGFAPEAADRKITKTASLSTEVERGMFKDAESKLKNIVTASDAFLLNENAQKYDNGDGRRSYYSGSYTIKVAEGKYDAVVSQLKQIGEVTWFSENKEDITEQFVDTKIELDAEKERLKRYQQMFVEASIVSDKIELNDRIFNQERNIKYLEDQLKNVGARVEYSTIYVTLTEKQSEYVNAVLVKFSELVTSLISSINSLLMLLFGIAPYAIAAVLVWFGVRKLRRKKK